MKKVLIGMLTVMLVMVGTLSPIAATSYIEGNIPVEEYYVQMKAEYAKYGVEYDVVDFGSVKEVSRKALEEGLASVREDGRLYQERRAMQMAKMNVMEEYFEKDSDLQLDTVTPLGSMFINKTFTQDGEFIKVGGLCRAVIRMTVNTTCEANNQEFVSIDSISSKKVGVALNFKSWRETDQVPRISGNVISAYVEGDLTFEYTEPNTGLTVSVTYEELVYGIWSSDLI